MALTAAGRRAVLMPTLHGIAPGDYGAASRVLRRAARRVIVCAPSVGRSLPRPDFPRTASSHCQRRRPPAARLPARRPTCRRLWARSAPLVIGIGAARGAEELAVFIAAAQRLAGPSFAVAGDGPLRRSWPSRPGGRRPGRFLGVVDDIAALIGLASCVVFTSAWEGLPLTLLEALSLGVPVVAPAVDGVADLVPPAAALLVPPGDPDAVAVAIDRVLADPRLARHAQPGGPGRRHGLATGPDAQAVPSGLSGSGTSAAVPDREPLASGRPGWPVAGPPCRFNTVPSTAPRYCRRIRLPSSACASGSFWAWVTRITASLTPAASAASVSPCRAAHPR